MLYNCSNSLDKANFLERAKLLADRGDVVELKTKKQRSLKQSAYLHCLFDYFGCQYGESGSYVKEEYFKKLVNPDIFVLSEGVDRFTGRQHYQLRSTADLTTEEMSICIDRFRDWASKEAGIYLPTAAEGALLRLCEIEISKAQRYL